MQTIRAIVRDELARSRPPALGTVTEVFSKQGDDAPDNHQVNVTLRGSGVELTRAPVAVGRLGLSMLPCVGDLVVVAFVDGDLNAPIVIGSVYDDTAHPPVAGPNEVVYQPPDAEESGVRRLHLELPSGSLVTFDDEQVRIELGGTAVTIAKDGDVTLQVAGKVVIESDGDLELCAAGNLRAEAGGTLELKGVSASLEGSGDAKVKGPSLTLAGNTSFSPS